MKFAEVPSLFYSISPNGHFHAVMEADGKKKL